MRKEIFAASVAAAAVDAHARKLAKIVTKQEYDVARLKWMDSGQHEMIRCLRNNLAHEAFVQADWRVIYQPNRTASSFEFQTKKLLLEGTFNDDARDYMQARGETIDVGQLFSDYSTKVEGFYGWYRLQIDSRLPAVVVGYRQCERSHRQEMVRTTYRLFISMWIQRKIDPYLYLDRFLEQDQIDEVQSLPPKSKVQVDRVIELADRDQACNDELRLQIYQLFGVA